MSFGKQSARLCFALVLTFLIAACGKGNNNNPTPPPTTPTGNVGGGALGPLNQQPAGTPLSQVVNLSEVMRAMNANLNGPALATAQSLTTTSYAIEYLYRGAQLTQVTQPQSQPVQGMTYSYYGQGDYYSTNFQIQLNNQYDGSDSGQYQLVGHINLQGLTLQSTDQVAFFQSASNPSEYLKVAYRSQNPAIARYSVSQGGNNGFSNYGGSNVPQIVVIQQNLATNFQQGYNTPNQYRTPQMQQPYYGPTNNPYQQQQQGGGYYFPGNLY